MLLGHPQRSFGHELDVEMQAGVDWLVANGHLTRDLTQSNGNWLTPTRKARQHLGQR